MNRRLPVYLLIDTSGDMIGAPTQALINGISSLVDDLLSDPTTVARVSMSVITFDSVATQVVPLTEIVAFTVPDICNHGSECFGEALKLLESCYDREIIRCDSETERADFKPLVFLIADGWPTDDWEEITDRLGSVVRARHKYAWIVALGVGSCPDFSVLKRLTDNVLLMPDYSDYPRFFKWMAQSIIKGSLPPLPPGIEAIPSVRADPIPTPILPPPLDPIDIVP